MPKIKVTYHENNPSINKRIDTSIEKKKIINSYIREGKDLKELNDKGIKLKQPI